MSEAPEATPVIRDDPEKTARQAAEIDKAHRVTAQVDVDGNTLVNTYQDVEPCMDYAAAMRRRDAEERGAFGRRPDMHQTMSVPFNIILAAAKRLGIQPKDIFDSDKSKRIYQELKRSEFSVFRTTIDRNI